MSANSCSILECGGLPPLSLPSAQNNRTFSTKLPWPHAPEHRLSEAGTFMVTAGTYRKKPFFAGEVRLRMLHRALLTIAKLYAWDLEAWAVFANHYHFVARSPLHSGSLTDFLRELHSRTASALNQYDRAVGRKVWHNYRETKLTHERSYLARLNYVHQNAVKHGLVSVAHLYPHSSAAWFERTATKAQVRTIYAFKIDRLNVDDDF